MPEITTKIGDLTGDQFLSILRGILEPRLSAKSKEIADLNGRIVHLEARLAAAEARLADR